MQTSCFSFTHKIRKNILEFESSFFNAVTAISVSNTVITGKRQKWNFLI